MADSILIPSKDGLARVDPKAKESKFGEADRRAQQAVRRGGERILEPLGSELR